MSNRIQSPKLKQAMEQIKQILQAHDIAAVVVLHTPEHSEFLMKIDPSYSVAKLVKEGLHIKTDPAEDVTVKKNN